MMLNLCCGGRDGRPPAAAHEKSEHRKHLDAIAEVSKQWTLPRFKASEAPLPGPRSKRVHFMRHGEGTHNELASKIGHDAYLDPRVKDARLTALGRQQAIANQERTAALTGVTRVLVSPLSRAVETATLGFAAALEKGVPFISRENLREQIGQNVCDQRRTVPELERSFPAVDFSQLQTEGDELWTVVRESKESVAKRGFDFMVWLGSLEDEEVAVVAHSSFLLTLFNVVLKCEDEALERWFDTGELRSVSIMWSEEVTQAGT